MKNYELDNSPELSIAGIDSLSSSDRMKFFEKFKELVEPAYGDQRLSIDKIDRAEDRSALVAIAGNEMVGTLVYKNSLQSEHGVDDAFEIKTLGLFDADKNSGLGYATELMNIALEKAQELDARGVLVTVSESRPEVVEFFKKNDFSIQEILHDKYQPGVAEFVMMRGF